MFYFTFFREVSSGYYLLQGETKLRLLEAHRKIPYKYVVVRRQGKPLWEYLVGIKPVVSGHVNRCLIIPESAIKSSGKYIG